MAEPRVVDAIDARVLIVSHSYGYSGDLMYFGEIFRHLQQRLPGLRVVVDRAVSYRNPYDLSLVPLLVQVRRRIERRTPNGEVYETEVAMPRPDFAWRLARQRADVIVAIEFTAPALIATLVACLSRRKRLVLLVESDPTARGGSRNRLVTALKRWAVQRAAILQTNNPHGQRYLVEELGADPEKVRIAPYLTSRPPGPPAAIALIPGRLRLLFANSLTPRKGFRELLEALALLPPAVRSKVALTIVGDGPERVELEGQAKDLAMGDRLVFAGRADYAALGPHYAAADVLVVPSRADYRSLAGFEGLAYGLALLSSCFDGATQETVVDGRNGFVIDPTDPQGLADRIAELAADPASTLAMRWESLRHYETLFSLERVSENLAESVRLARLAA